MSCGSLFVMFLSGHIRGRSSGFWSVVCGKVLLCAQEVMGVCLPTDVYLCVCVSVCVCVYVVMYVCVCV